MITAIANAYIETLKATPEAERAKIATWYVEDMTKIRAFFKIG
jgi:hypothetical protein